MARFLKKLFNSCIKWVLRKFKISSKTKIFIINHCLFASFILFYLSYYFFINGVVNPAVRIVFDGNIIADQTLTYENSIIESIWLLFESGSYFNMILLLFFSIIIPIFKFIVVSDNFYTFFKLHNLSLKRYKVKKKKNHYDHNSELFYINTVNDNDKYMLKKFNLLCSISRFQFVDVMISLFIASSLNVYLLETKLLNGTYYFLNYCVLSTISSLFLSILTSIKIEIFKKSNIKIYSVSSGKCFNNGYNLSNSFGKSITTNFNGYVQKNFNDSDVDSYNEIHNDVEQIYQSNMYDNKDISYKESVQTSKLKKKGHSKESNIQGDGTTASNDSVVNSNYDNTTNTNEYNMLSTQKINKITGEITKDDNNNNNKKLLLYNKLEALHNISYLYKLMKKNDAYIYIKKKKFNFLLKKNGQMNKLNIFKLGYIIFVFLILCLCTYLIIKVENDMFGIYIYLSYFNFNIEGVLVDYNDMLNILKFKIGQLYIYTFFIILPFLFPIITVIFLFLSIFFMNLYYINFSMKYKKNNNLFSDELIIYPEVESNQKMMLSERYNYLFIKKEFEKNDNLSNTSDDTSSYNGSTISSSKSEVINTSFIHNKILNFYFFLSVFFSFLCSFCLHLSLGEIISIALLTFYQIVKHTNKLNIIILYKSSKTYFCKFLVFFIYALFCFTINLYVKRWSIYVNKLKKLKKKILLFEKNRYSEIIDLNIQKLQRYNNTDSVTIFSFFFDFIYNKKKWTKIDDGGSSSSSNKSSTSSISGKTSANTRNIMINHEIASSANNFKRNYNDTSNMYKYNTLFDHQSLFGSTTLYPINEQAMLSGNQNTIIIKEDDEPYSFNIVKHKNQQQAFIHNNKYITFYNDLQNELISGVGSYGERDIYASGMRFDDNYNYMRDYKYVEYIRNNDSFESNRNIYGTGNNPRGFSGNNPHSYNNIEFDNNSDIYIYNNERYEDSDSYSFNGYSNDENNNFYNTIEKHEKNIIPIKSSLLTQFDKNKNLKKKKKRNSTSDGFSIKSKIYHFLFFSIILITSVIAFYKKEKVFSFDMKTVNKRLNTYFHSPSFYKMIPNSIGKCKTKKYLAKNPCFNVGRIYHEETTFYHATLLYIQNISSLQMNTIKFYYADEKYYLLLTGFFTYILGPLFVKLCVGSSFCPITTYAYFVGDKPTFSLTIEASCNDKGDGEYISNIVVTSLNITKLQVIKHSDVIDDVDIPLDDVHDRVKEKINEVLAAQQKFINWKNKDYTLEGFINYMISNNILSGFSCTPNI
ncbi:conserved membrane protein, unknown function [Hepatocystis sp. ex Piliocolobus tephrosceles]|nr:conserved membrane protein, unknown function [Hepatocystis sp. ex Piliocolobus tephrosceles]VWU51147.1 conserved membrane protein, unknown function [Hepatocystis sp. ex Piliocolobus tephrosceles]